MSFLGIIQQVWGNGTSIIYALVKAWLRPPALSRTDNANTILLTESEKYADLLVANSPVLSHGRSRPEWMTHGIDTSHKYEDHTEPFPTFDVVECEEAAMRVAHAQAGLLPPAHPLFAPDLTPIDGMSAVRADVRQYDDVFIHVAEARDALRTALHFASGKARSRYQHSHPAFASPKTPWRLNSSPLADEMTRCLTKTYQGCRHSVRVAPPSQIRLELETCLILAFASYVLSDAFMDAGGKNTIVPEFFAFVVEEGARWNPHATREVIYLCEEGLVEDGEDFLKLWEAWRWVVKIYIGILVLRHRHRPREDIIWA
ncbi:hypothetical protein P171DRAFT_447822 [Karstenula rhodostoma CBS 690.94]|uniref:Uncharacterized protein n=1 Tax=Karstenula rhodostoma CBS 690.94 TaxID=1392251 RepID=A0A9P4U8A3_9PLEO|nr:hypothetical protein P171DRAFT_447822 [Karstenula rhodostoma CBS 690.94]